MSYTRSNNATNATIERSMGIFASGTFKNVWQGVYTDGVRKGHKCVAKEFKTGSVLEAHYFEEELEIVARTQKIIDDFDAAGIIDRKIWLNTPQIWTYEGDFHKCLVEPMIVNFERFNSNTGWASRR
jgi:hypothetical protein